MDKYKIAYNYVVGADQRTVLPAHHNYQVSLKRFLQGEERDVEFEKDFVDVTFTVEEKTYIGEIKVTTYLSVSEAFRTALGQLLEHAHLGPHGQPGMVMFLDQPVDSGRIQLATKLGIAVVVQQRNSFVLLNPRVAPSLRRVFTSS